ncbi:hypothetical protein LZC95_00315 [Pendulispora brunnea]|uniref:Uncharacterized protein n=1 Tax=Pendulispora brunnea TaxID=2905690 RepID=A0ABZ2K9B7_9BACT
MAIAGAIAALVVPAHAAEKDEKNEKDEPPPPRTDPVFSAVAWTVAQLVPSPLLVLGSDRAGAGVRWQITPFVYSFGVAEHPVRAFIVDPVARHSGAIELYASPEWACCAPDDRTGWIARAGGRLYLPVIGRGETLSWSLGGSYYRAAGGGGGSIETGAYFLFGTMGLTVTVSPELVQREIITAFNIRYF